MNNFPSCIFKRQNFAQVIFLVSLFLLGSCTENRVEKSPPSSPGKNFLQGADLDTIRESLMYSCNPTPIMAPSSAPTAESQTTGSECKVHELKNYKTTVELNWFCNQTDHEKLGRTLPIQAQFSLPVIINIENEKVGVSYDYEILKSFFKGALSGNTSYTSCIDKFFRYEHLPVFSIEKVRQQVEGCDANSFAKKVTKSNLKTYVEKLFAESAERDRNEVLLQPIMPYYEKIGFSPSLKNVTDCTAIDIASYEDINLVKTPAISIEDSALPALSKIYLEGGQIKRRDLTNQCTRIILNSLGPKYHLSSGCSTRTENPNCKIQIQNYLNVLKSIDPSSENLSQQLIADNYDIKKFQIQFENWVTQVKDESENVCEPLPIGKSKIVKNEKTPIYGTYKLYRESEKKNLVEINVSFAPDCESDEFENKKVSDAWFKKVNHCLATVSPYFKTKNDEQIEIRVVSQTELEGGAGQHSITVTKDNTRIREHSNYYSVNSDCRVIVHEILHLTGLVDEYVERTTENNFQCRAQGPQDSIMHSHWEAYDRTDNLGISLLKPAHARFILYPNCEDKNQIYYQCSSKAYIKDYACSSNDYPQECRFGATTWIDQ